MSTVKNQSNPFSTGGGGAHFEAHVQASFVVLMLSGGYAPCLPCWPIVEIKLQGKIDGFNVDDLIVVAENPRNKERRKLLGQVKHSIVITKANPIFGEVIKAAWYDFKNPQVFTKGKDVIALITSRLPSATDVRSIEWLLNQARHTRSVDEFFRNIQQANFSPPKSIEKLEVIQHHLRTANGGDDVSRDELYDFLKHFYLLGYDLCNEFGVVLSLLHSHISQFQPQNPHWVWSRVVDIVQTWNQDAGTIMLDNLPEDLVDVFEQRVAAKMPERFKAAPERTELDWAHHPEATFIALAVLIGSWQDNNQYDHEAITQLLGVSYDEWLKKAREILHQPDSPLSLNLGIWQVVNRAEFWSLLASRILDRDLDTFRLQAISILKEPDPALEPLAEKQHAGRFRVKVLKHSHVLRKGIADGLAILGSQPEACSNCSRGKAEETCDLVLRELLTDADWFFGGSLNELLPSLAEATPGKFLCAVEKAMRLSPCPFDRLFSQRGTGTLEYDYLTGLLWALEVLAWDKQYLLRVCALLAELASHDPGGQYANRPFDSLVTILLPWLPQTFASVEKRRLTVETILKEQPEVGWSLIVQLLPGQRRDSFGSYRPKWRKTIPDDRVENVTPQEYWQEVSFYAELAVTTAGHDIGRLSTLTLHLDKLPQPAFGQLLQTLSSEPVLSLPEEQRLLIWNHLTQCVRTHRRFSHREWALPDEFIVSIEQVAQQLAPKDPFYLYQHLFIDRDDFLYANSGDLEEQKEKLEARREKAVLEIFQQGGINNVVRFAEYVPSPYKVGYTLGAIPNTVIDKTLLPHLLDSAEHKHRALVSSFIWRRHHIKGWEWCDGIDKSDWIPAQIGQFLGFLPFTKEAWNRASAWLQESESEYWTRTHARGGNSDLTVAVEKLIEHGRPYKAIDCLYTMLYNRQQINSGQCVQALLAALSSGESGYVTGSSEVAELIKFLQDEPSVSEEELLKVEWAYLPLLGRCSGSAPKLLENKLASDPEFFCMVVQMGYRPKKEHQPRSACHQKSKADAEKAWQLLHRWKTPPGTQKDGAFSEERFTEWLQRVKAICTESGHLEVALNYVGKVLIHIPPDPDGLWIHRAAAAALNDREADDMRAGYRTETYYSRSARMVVPTGKPQRELAEQFRKKAEEIEDAGFYRFAVTLRDLADYYDREARRIVSVFQQSVEDR